MVAKVTRNDGKRTKATSTPLAAPIYADLKGLAPLLIQVGACETLLHDALRLAKVAGTADMRVDLQIWPEMVHVWHLFHPS